MQIGIKLMIFFGMEAFVLLLFVAYEAYRFVRMRKSHADDKRAGLASDVCVALILLNTLLYILLIRSYVGVIPQTFKMAIAGSMIAWSLFSYIVLCNGQRVCDSVGMQGMKSRKLFHKDLVVAFVIVILWTVLFNEVVKPIALHRPVFAFEWKEITLSWGDTFAPLLMYCIIAPINEEVLFRHGILTAFLEVLKGKSKELSPKVVVLAMAFVSVLFSMAHMQNNYLLKVIQIMPIAVVLAVVYKRQNLWQSILVHMFFNFLNFVL